MSAGKMGTAKCGLYKRSQTASERRVQLGIISVVKVSHEG